MTKIINDKYYTPIDLARRLMETTINVLVNSGVKDISDIIEPSAGNRVREFAQSIAMKKMSMMRFYKYLKDNIEGIE